jgi:hypothetical protein
MTVHVAALGLVDDFYEGNLLATSVIQNPVQWGLHGSRDI